MKLLYVVQRYGEAIAGGAEQHCREMAERMVARGHRVEVVTTCASSYVDWANTYPEGQSELNGVVVHRCPVAQPRDPLTFDRFNDRMSFGRGARPLAVQREWQRLQGPYSPALATWLERYATSFDCVVCFTYLYWTTEIALRLLGGIVPVVLHPTVHDERALRLSLFDEVFHAPDAFALSTPEEVSLIRRRFRFDPPGAVVGVGFDIGGADVDGFRDRYSLGDAPYLLYAGRVDRGKGAGDLVDFFAEYQRRHTLSDLRLVFVGELLMDLPGRDDIVATGFVSRERRDSALAGALALVQPSRFESFSMVLTEAFAHGTPALVEARNEVLLGHALRSSGAIPYQGFAEFECAVEMLYDDPALAQAMGRSGRRYAEREYTWDVVMDRYEALLNETISALR
jgi:glycosyltransferase involved in cell wall biosynthesis